MKNEESWRPTRLTKRANGTFGVFVPHVYGGSLHILERQWAVYEPIFRAHIRGALLDVACGAAPYYQVYRPMVDEVVCLDHPQGIHGISHVDVRHDLNANERLPFPDERFDTVLATDMLPQVQRPEAFMREVARILKPGGKAIVSSSFVNWMGEYPNEYMHVSGPGLGMLADRAALEPLLIQSYGGHTDVFLDTINKYFPQGVGNRMFRFFALVIERTGWPRRCRARTGGRYALGNIMVAVRSRL